VKLRLDGKQRSIPVAREGPSILQAGLQAGMPLPYACQAGVCCTCRAKVIEGEVRMIRNYTLQADEIAQGFVLACQAHPVSDEVLLSFDER
jgi:ring-1,2-phenylacetyl-CoA epoxidase subunit PaaE